MTNCNCQKSNCDCGSSSSGFVFGLICGAIIGAVIAVIIYKNNKTEVFEKLEQKIKSFFEDLTGQETTKSTHPKKPIIAKSIPQEIKPVSIKAKKHTPKTFIKSKK